MWARVARIALYQIVHSAHLYTSFTMYCIVLLFRLCVLGLHVDTPPLTANHELCVFLILPLAATLASVEGYTGGGRRVHGSLHSRHHLHIREHGSIHSLLYTQSVPPSRLEQCHLFLDICVCSDWPRWSHVYWWLVG